MKTSRLVKTVLVSSPLFLAGCSCTQDDVYYERRYRDGVPVVVTYQPGWHYSTFYHGYVPIIVPIGGYSGGHTYHHYYNTLPPAQRQQYAPPVTRPATNNSQPAGAKAGAVPIKAPSTSATGTSRGIAGSTGSGSVSS